MKKCMKCGGAKMQKGGMATKALGPAKKPFAAGIPYFIGAGQTGPESMQKGGSKVTAVKHGCPPGTVRSESGGCVSQRPSPFSKMKKGGFPDLNKDGKITKADVLKGRGVIKKMGGAIKKK